MKPSVHLLTVIAVILISSSAALAQQSAKYKTLCRTWKAGTVELQMHFPYDTTVFLYSGPSKTDTIGFSKFRITLNNTGVYSGISPKGEASKGTWALSKNESKLNIRKSTGKKVEYEILRVYPNYMELGIKKLGTRTVFKMVPE